jgi:hypothetical protein
MLPHTSLLEIIIHMPNPLFKPTSLDIQQYSSIKTDTDTCGKILADCLQESTCIKHCRQAPEGTLYVFKRKINRQKLKDFSGLQKQTYKTIAFNNNNKKSKAKVKAKRRIQPVK